MNIISNCCAAGEFYRRILNTSYKNPFIWCSIKPKDMYYLIEHYADINFLNYEISKNELETKMGTFRIIVDNKISIYYLHYHFNQADYKIRTDGVNVYYNRIWEYVVKKYEERAKKMLMLKEEPIFLLLSDRVSLAKIDDNWLDKILDIKTNYKIVIVGETKRISNNSNILYINENSKNHVIILDKYQNKIKEFLGLK